MNKKIISGLFLIIAGAMVGWYGFAIWQINGQVSVLQQANNDTSARLTKIETWLDKTFGQPAATQPAQDNAK